MRTPVDLNLEPFLYQASPVVVQFDGANERVLKRRSLDRIRSESYETNSQYNADAVDIRCQTEIMSIEKQTENQILMFLFNG